jgi:hypothetical protein
MWRGAFPRPEGNSRNRDGGGMISGPAEISNQDQQ